MVDIDAPLFLASVAVIDSRRKQRGSQLNNANQLGNTTTQYDCSKEEARFIDIGKTNQGRSLFIAFTLHRHSDEVLIRPISARYMHQKEVDHYEKEITRI